MTTLISLLMTLLLTACASTATMTDVKNALPPEALRTAEPEIQYTVELRIWEDEARAEDGTLLVSRSFRLPVMTVCREDGTVINEARTEAESAALAAAAAFNERFEEWTSGTAFQGLAAEAETDLEWRRSEGMEWQTGYELTLDCMVYQTDRLVSIAGSYYSYIEGAAHPNTWQMGWTFDLEAGAFVEPEELSEGAALGDAVTAEILQLAALPTEDGPAATEQYWEDYEEIVANWTGYAVFFDGTGMNVVFSPYELACYAAGPQAFHIAYEKLEPGLNQRGRTLLGLDMAE
ncbi:DUF3298 and DUF4163 domain-containing protein [uncultured Dysosmobacter sp.]|uniref:DUF3298 and DUF4163 domain-containing protein n=1 Tax=uncultured Dysosmobacter sp. TaxID=2591384 RepID=UPI002608EEB8|nr:DUF3298 and DUF4163 domain-containing protein [uncultured Dysosmobacter sp.]